MEESIDEAAITPPRKRRSRPTRNNSPLTVPLVCEWVELYHHRTGAWPKVFSKAIGLPLGERWQAVDMALRQGHRTLPGGYSLARLLDEHFGVRNIGNLPHLSVEKILGWADAHHARTGTWPHLTSGRIQDAAGETWSGVNAALVTGLRGFAGGSSLARLLLEQRRVRHKGQPPRLTLRQIVAWADAYHKQHGKWPAQYSGPVAGVPGETWSAVDLALRVGRRGLAGGSSLPKLLAERRGKRHKHLLPKLTIKQILAWADAHQKKQGRWPTALSGPIHGTNGETWRRVDAALSQGQRGMPGGSSLARLLAARRGARNPQQLPKLSIRQIRSWARSHFRRTGQWPNTATGQVAEAPGEVWFNIDAALRTGLRGLRRRTTLRQLLLKN